MNSHNWRRQWVMKKVGKAQARKNDKARYEDSWECTIRAGSRSFLFGTLLHSTTVSVFWSVRFCLVLRDLSARNIHIENT